jgi:hypothetical protein
MADHNGTVQALLIERIGYERRGLTHRVAQVDELLARLGIAVESAAVEPQAETATRKKPLKRKRG